MQNSVINNGASKDRFFTRPSSITNPKQEDIVMTKLSVQSNQNKSKIKIGDKFNRLTIIEEAGYNKRNRPLWKCKCSCGVVKIILGNALQTGNTKSCGCLSLESKTKHGMFNSVEYTTWKDMVKRCNKPSCSIYEYYGGRGITVCTQWLKFENFFKDMGIKPEGLTLERIDNDKGYYKGNCCWASMLEQSKNKRILKNNKTGVTGVFWEKRRKKYSVSLSVNYKSYFIGYFKTIEEATTARKQAEQKYQH